MMSLTPSVFSDKYYGWTTVFLLGTLVFAFLLAAKVFFRDLVKVKDKSWLIIGCLISILCVETFLSKVEALYWYNSGVHYTFMTACMIVMLALTTKIIIEDQWKKEVFYVIFACLFSFITSGGNYINALLGIILFVTIICVGILCRQKRAFLAIVPAIVYGLGFYMNVSAPGNAVRQSYFEKLSVLDTVMESFKASFTYEKEWFSLFTLLYLILLFPVLWNHSKKSHYSFRFPWLVPLYCICLVASSFAPSFYSMGIAGGGRTLNVSKLIFQLCLIVCEWYFCGYINRLFEKREKNFSVRNTILFYIVVMGVMVLSVAAETKDERIQNYATYGSIYYMSSGEAESYYAAYRMRLPYFKLGDEHVVLDRFPIRPSYLYFDDITTEPDDWRNRGMAVWYGVDSVVLNEGY